MLFWTLKIYTWKYFEHWCLPQVAFSAKPFSALSLAQGCKSNNQIDFSLQYFIFNFRWLLINVTFGTMYMLLLLLLPIHQYLSFWCQYCLPFNLTLKKGTRYFNLKISQTPRCSTYSPSGLVSAPWSSTWPTSSRFSIWTHRPKIDLKIVKPIWEEKICATRFMPKASAILIVIFLIILHFCCFIRSLLGRGFQIEMIKGRANPGCCWKVSLSNLIKQQHL